MKSLFRGDGHSVATSGIEKVRGHVDVIARCEE